MAVLVVLQSDRRRAGRDALADGLRRGFCPARPGGLQPGRRHLEAHLARQAGEGEGHLYGPRRRPGGLVRVGAAVPAPARPRPHRRRRKGVPARQGVRPVPHARGPADAGPSHRTRRRRGPSAGRPVGPGPSARVGGGVELGLGRVRAMALLRGRSGQGAPPALSHRRRADHGHRQRCPRGRGQESDPAGPQPRLERQTALAVRRGRPTDASRPEHLGPAHRLHRPAQPRSRSEGSGGFLLRLPARGPVSGPADAAGGLRRRRQDPDDRAAGVSRPNARERRGIRHELETHLQELGRRPPRRFSRRRHDRDRLEHASQHAGELPEGRPPVGPGRRAGPTRPAAQHVRGPLSVGRGGTP